MRNNSRVAGTHVLHDSIFVVGENPEVSDLVEIGTSAGVLIKARRNEDFAWVN